MPPRPALPLQRPPLISLGPAPLHPRGRGLRPASRRGLLGLALLLQLCFQARADPPTVELVSTPNDPLILGTQPITGASSCQLSRDGSIVAFRSSAWNLVPGDTNGRFDIFVRSRIAGTLQRITRPDGVELSEAPTDLRLSGDGTRISFSTSEALDPADGNDDVDIYLWYADDGAIELVSRSGAGEAVGGRDADVSNTGRYVTFQSDAPELTGGSAFAQVFRLDRDTGLMEPISLTAAGTFGNGQAQRPRIIGPRYVAFESAATDLVAGDSNGQTDVFVRDLTLGTTQRVSVSSSGAQLTSSSSLLGGASNTVPTVVFSTSAAAVPADTNGLSDVFRIRLDTGAVVHLTPRVAGGFRSSGVISGPAVTRNGLGTVWAGLDGDWDPADGNDRYDVFHATNGNGARAITATAGDYATDGSSTSPCANDDASVVAFTSDATNLLAVDVNDASDVVLCDGDPCVYESASAAESPLPIAVDVGRSTRPDASADLRFVVFEAAGGLLAPGLGDGRTEDDLVLRDRQSGINEVLTPGEQTGSDPVVSDDGRYVAFLSAWFPPLHAPAGPSQNQAFLLDRSSASVRMLSVDGTGAGGDARVTSIAMSGDGSTVVFSSAASNLVPGDLNGRDDVFVYDIAAEELVRLGSGTSQGGGFEPRVSRDGRRIVFTSFDSDYVADDSNSSNDVFAHDRDSGIYLRLSQGALEQGDNDSEDPDISDDGSQVVFTSRATNLLPAGSGNGEDRLYRVAALGGTLEAIGRRPDGSPLAVGDEAHSGRLSADGSVVVHLVDLDDVITPGAVAPADLNGLVMRSTAGGLSEVFSITPDGLWTTTVGDARTYVPGADGDRIVFATSSGEFAPQLDHNGVEDVYLLTRVATGTVLFANGFEAPPLP